MSSRNIITVALLYLATVWPNFNEVKSEVALNSSPVAQNDCSLGSVEAVNCGAYAVGYADAACWLGCTLDEWWLQLDYAWYTCLEV